MHLDAAPRLDLRLVPAALTAWVVTAAGIVWSIGPAIAVVCTAVGVAAVGVCRWLLRRGESAVVRAVGLGVVGAAVVGAGFGLAVGLRSDAVRGHAITHRFGTAAWVTVTPGESPRSVGSGRLMFRGALARVGDDEISGRVVVFAPGTRLRQARCGPAGPVPGPHQSARPSRPDRRGAHRNG